MSKIMVQYGRPSCSSCTKFIWSSFGKTIVRKTIRKSSIRTRFEIVLNRECLFANREKRLSLSVYVDGLQLDGQKQNLDPTWKILMKDVDLGEPTSFLDNIHLGCTQRECQRRKDIADNYRSMFESRISAELIEKRPSTVKFDAHISSWSCDMVCHAKKCVER